MTSPKCWTRGRMILCAAALATLLTSGAAVAQSSSPYDTIFKARQNTPIYSSMSTSGKAIGTIPRGAGGIVLRWCRPEIPFGDWQFGGKRAKRAILDQRWCEIGYKGTVGNVQGRSLNPGR